MPLLSVEHISEDVRLALWRFDETFEMLSSCYPNISNSGDFKRRKGRSLRRNGELIVERLLLDELFGNDVELLHDGDGRPFLSNGCNISISHTKGCVAAIVAETKNVAVDAEYVNDRVNRIAARFMRNDEISGTLFERLLHWCVKETLYKFYSSDKLEFNDIRLVSFGGAECGGRAVAVNLKRNESLAVCYRTFDNILLTYAFA